MPSHPLSPPPHMPPRQRPANHTQNLDELGLSCRDTGGETQLHQRPKTALSRHVFRSTAGDDTTYLCNGWDKTVCRGLSGYHWPAERSHTWDGWMVEGGEKHPYPVDRSYLIWDVASYFASPRPATTPLSQQGKQNNEETNPPSQQTRGTRARARQIIEKMAPFIPG